MVTDVCGTELDTSCGSSVYYKAGVICLRGGSNFLCSKLQLEVSTATTASTQEPWQQLTWMLSTLECLQACSDRQTYSQAGRQARRQTDRQIER